MDERPNNTSQTNDENRDNNSDQNICCNICARTSRTNSGLLQQLSFC